MLANQEQTWDYFRNHDRLAFQTPVHIVVLNRLAGVLFGVPRIVGRTDNVSMTGMLITTGCELPPKAKLRIKVNISVSGHGEADLRGVVAWSRADESGKAFMSGIRICEKPRSGMKRWLAFVGERLRSLR